MDQEDAPSWHEAKAILQWIIGEVFALLIRDEIQNIAGEGERVVIRSWKIAIAN